ncbi:hypothetical protein OG195_12430 [Streptomyces sp. NBC_01362]|uniref:hypothetical protein n=1 Tax=Streptomyces sp. NBC_01362 TaxID=2903839 RepID=UPI002E33AEDE|nr:hypothetical protein [Streptomyces sp. NBC_01362]
MKNIVAGHVAVTATEFTELALGIDLGIDLELFTGPAVESAMERAARVDVAKEVLAELRESDPETATYAESLLRTLPLKRRSDGRRPRRTVRRPVSGRAAGSAVAA